MCIRDSGPCVVAVFVVIFLVLAWVWPKLVTAAAIGLLDFLVV